MMNKNFTEIKSSYLNEANGNGYWLKHNRTGLQVIYFKCDTKKRFFHFTFHTPGIDETDTAHVVEHMIFRGSKNFPSEDLAKSIDQNSFNYTNEGKVQPGHSAYYAGSYVKKDFQNMFEVFGDALFFPLFDEYAFEQESVHLDLDENGMPFLNGIIYNEQKYKDKTDILLFDTLREAGFNDSALKTCENNYLKLPELTYSHFKEYYKKYYVPSNCYLFLYGPDSLEEQLDFIEEKLLSKLPDYTPAPIITVDFKDITKTIFTTSTLFSQEEQKDEYLFAIRARRNPNNPRDDSILYNSLLLLIEDTNKFSINAFLNKANVGSEIASEIICLPYCYLLTINIKKPEIDDSAKIEEIINNCIEKAVKKQFSKELVDDYYDRIYFSEEDSPNNDCMHEMDFYEAIDDGFFYGDPFLFFDDDEAVIRLKEDLISGNYAEFLEQNLIMNTERALVTIKHDTSYKEKRAKLEAEIVNNLYSKTTNDEILNKIKQAEILQNEKCKQTYYPAFDWEEVKGNEETKLVENKWPETHIESCFILNGIEDDDSITNKLMTKHLYGRKRKFSEAYFYNDYNYNGMMTALKTSPSGTTEQFDENFLMYMLMTSDLMTKIRLQHNAYIAEATYSGCNPYITFVTQRDPHPETSRKLFLQTIAESCHKNFDQNIINRLVMIIKAKNQWEHENLIELLPEFGKLAAKERDEKLNHISSINSKTLNEAAKRLLKINTNPKTCYYIEDSRRNSCLKLMKED